ncbi:23S rRNA (uracil(1939)-C(5))-methyltransferase RlmD [Anaerobiospirillum sp. NML120449]|uniref:23S rRNA (uracil(1939)-C(5))-methyltransferase RlmD n=1 Tax=Anaerobiospirillum sp. NML120449 TaxID=2932817 RepID=UPI001FF4A1F6|nr:23S rRNA (uracil(1939)-C(5))-methyltransferase RlmD [Anaerobiospirillum sp. NML120449]MCK0527306.1 23S rRNA (uracil(1939)-C(5))-methyltransferase RlmD [Anaerobiospirillum sp. NML120449]
MVSFYKAEKKTGAAKALELKCESLDIQGRGVCKKDGMVYFVDNLMPGESARVVPESGNAIIAGSLASKDKSRSGRVSKYLETSPERRAQSCPLQDQCGGCPLEHLPPAMSLQAKIEGIGSLLSRSVAQGTLTSSSAKASKSQGSSRLGRNSTIKQVLAQKQAAAKNAARLKELNELSRQAADAIARPVFCISGEETGYRRACRLAIRADHGKMHLGFREGRTQDLVPVTFCEVLTERNNSLLEPLKGLVNAMTARKNIGHVELLDTDGAAGVLLRMTCVLGADDEQLLRDFGKEHGTVMSVLEPYKQLDDTEVVRERVIYEDEEHQLYVMSHDCRIACSPSSFVQVNGAMNQAMVEQVLKEIAPNPDMKVLDLFSGLGNFSLPVAKAGAQVAGVDIVSDMVRRANDNAAANGIDHERARFYIADLEEAFETQLWAKENYDVVVMDPGRMGAKRAVGYMSKIKPGKIVMISCNPLAASRDTTTLVSAGYTLQSWGAIDMFPRTSHLEIMLVFTRNEGK